MPHWACIQTLRQVQGKRTPRHGINFAFVCGHMPAMTCCFGQHTLHTHMALCAVPICLCMFTHWWTVWENSLLSSLLPPISVPGTSGSGGATLTVSPLSGAGPQVSSHLRRDDAFLFAFGLGGALWGLWVLACLAVWHVIMAFYVFLAPLSDTSNEPWLSSMSQPDNISLCHHYFFYNFKRKTPSLLVCVLLLPLLLYLPQFPTDRPVPKRHQQQPMHNSRSQCKNPNPVISDLSLSGL